MDPAVATIIVALITTVGGLIGIAIKEFKNMRRENRDDHGAVMTKLNRVQEENNIVIRRLGKIQDNVEQVRDRLDDHIDWHLKK